MHLKHLKFRKTLLFPYNKTKTKETITTTTTRRNTTNAKIAGSNTPLYFCTLSYKQQKQQEKNKKTNKQPIHLEKKVRETQREKKKNP